MANNTINRQQMLESIFADSDDEEQRFIKRVYCKMEINRIQNVSPFVADVKSKLAIIETYKERLRQLQ